MNRIHSRFKIFSDPIHGFISVPKGPVLELIETPEVQRLRRIRQLGLGYMVFPGAEHTRFGHALGALALMHDALQSLQEKGTPISPKEYEAALAIALLHDIGHGPFSHTLEHVLIRDFHHEAMSRALIGDLNRRFGGRLDLVLTIFDNAYERPFFHQLIAGQLDMDRLDYLRRDAAYTGVSEGVVGVERIIKTLRVHPDDYGPKARLVVESKGIYAVESFLVARRMMYWQVYLHKTVLAGDFLLRSILDRFRNLEDRKIPCISSALQFFISQELSASDVDDPEVRKKYVALDDVDILFSIKQWSASSDAVLADLSRRFLNRDFLRVKILEELPSPDWIETCREAVKDWLKSKFPDQDADSTVGHYFLFSALEHAAYSADVDSIAILDRSNNLKELSRMADAATIRALDTSIKKWYICYPKDNELRLPEPV